MFDLWSGNFLGKFPGISTIAGKNEHLARLRKVVGPRWRLARGAHDPNAQSATRRPFWNTNFFAKMIP